MSGSAAAAAAPSIPASWRRTLAKRLRHRSAG
ncbi:MAG: hypothetical protein JXR94_14620 [Candidatus Hydrogenedentes bacterium]|nr:hypothetical protein [Candidatus Hydrogenedentota bacterium]